METVCYVRRVGSGSRHVASRHDAALGLVEVDALRLIELDIRELLCAMTGRSH